MRSALDDLPRPACHRPDRATNSPTRHPLDGATVAPTERGPLVTGPPDVPDLRPGRHAPLRPLWLCRSCATARLALTSEYHGDRIALIIYLSLQLAEADEHLHALNPAEAPAPGHLFDRFVGWARRNTRARPVTSQAESEHDVNQRHGERHAGKPAARACRPTV
ncbi:hypothetical protein [Micromonospora fluostatini]|uniref:hypothetical protein n=1 Tax=Micromonospora sp. JCM 30529 TaxID=3421643 RepID=UPI003D16C762